MQLAPGSGYVDLVVLPTRGLTKLVIVEAKRADDSRSGADVLGQLFKYYAHALTLTTAHVERMKVFADEISSRRPSRLISSKMLFGKLDLMCTPELTSRNIQLVVALDHDAAKFGPRLVKTARALKKEHAIPLSVFVVSTQTWLVARGIRKGRR